MDANGKIKPVNTDLNEFKVHLITDHKGPRGIALLILNFGRPGHFTPGKDPVPFVQEVGWAPGPVWACTKNLAPPGYIPGPSSP
jgi:hypothetical protein